MADTVRMIVLAAGRGTRLRPLTADRPKCLVEVGGRTLLDWQRRAGRAAGLPEPILVGGHGVDALRGLGLDIVVNERHERTNMVASLMRAAEYFGDGFVASYGDIAYSPAVLRSLLDSPGDISVAIDDGWRDYWENRFDDPLSDAESCRVDLSGRLVEVGQVVEDIDEIQGQFMGLVRFRADGVDVLRETTAHLDISRLFMTDLLQAMVGGGVHVQAATVTGGWIEVDDRRDLAVAEDLVLEGRLS